MRLGDYEVLPSNRWCYQVYRVMPEGFDNSRSRYRQAEDGHALAPVECYPTTVRHAVAKVAELAAMDGLDAGGAEGLLARLDALFADIGRLAGELPGADGQPGCARGASVGRRDRPRGH